MFCSSEQLQEWQSREQSSDSGSCSGFPSRGQKTEQKDDGGTEDGRLKWELRRPRHTPLFYNNGRYFIKKIDLLIYWFTVFAHVEVKG